MINRLVARWRQRRLLKSGRALTGVVSPSPAIEKVVRDLNELARKNGWSLSDTVETGGCCGGDCACDGKKSTGKKKS